MSCIVEAYGDRKVWEKLLGRCIEGIIATEPDPSVKVPPPSYSSFMEEASALGFTHARLTPQQIRNWCEKKQIVDELLRVVQEAFNQLPSNFSIVEEVDALGALLHRIEHLDSLGSEKHRLAHLFLNYLGAYCNQPLIVFRKEERQRYLQALSSLPSTQALLAEKIREAVLKDGEFLERSVHTRLTDRYCQEGEEKSELTIQWNELVRAKTKPS